MKRKNFGRSCIAILLTMALLAVCPGSIQASGGIIDSRYSGGIAESVGENKITVTANLSTEDDTSVTVRLSAEEKTSLTVAAELSTEEDTSVTADLSTEEETSVTTDLTTEDSVSATSEPSTEEETSAATEPSSQEETSAATEPSTQDESSGTTDEPTQDDTVSTSEEEQPAKKKNTVKTVKLIAVGDDLIHSSVYQAAKRKSGYNFNMLFKNIKSEVKAADVAVINQETMLVGGNYSGYPCFGSPYAVADAIAKAGFTVVTQATNHAMDRGSSAILGTLKYWKKQYPSITVLGIHSSKKDANRIKVIKVNGIKIAMLNYTYGLNGIPLPYGKSYLVDRLDSKAAICRDIKKAKKKADFVVVFAHWGTEYTYTPDSSQKNWTSFFLHQGVDLLIGGHPHVVQPYKMLKSKSGHKMLVYYSLGNFVSGQARLDTMLGGMAKVTIVKDSKGTRIKSYTMKALVTHISAHHRAYTTYLLSEYKESLARVHNLRLTGHAFSKSALKKLYRRITGKSKY